MTARRYMMGCTRIGHGSPAAGRELAEILDDLWRLMDGKELERVEKAIKRRGVVLRMGLALFADKAPPDLVQLEGMGLPIASAVVGRRGPLLHIELGQRLQEPAFVEVHPRTERLEKAFFGLLTRQWLMSLGAMYLITGRYAPSGVRGGCRFGFCDDKGIRMAKAVASHIGWTLEEVACDSKHDA